MKAVILAGGLGTRLKPFTEIIPKPLLPIGEKAVLEVQIEALSRNGFDEIYLATNYKSDYIQNFIGNGDRYGINIIISKEKKPLGTVGPLTLLKDKLQEPFLVMNGDILTLLNFSSLYEFAISTQSLLTVSIKEFITPFQFGNIFFDGDYVTKIDEKPKIKTNILAGIYIFKPEIFELIPDDEYFGMDMLINKMLNLKIPISKYEIKEYWLDIGQIDDFQLAQLMYKEHFTSSDIL
ncbi:MAG: sugar phosphate nucleotidyltransferase [Ignavibacteriaceae bacterium]|nr:sugar phosphate nucleotidyltransferase [Ignavibacteriaceae bacterium]